MAEQSLTWHGPALTAKMRAAQIAGVNKTMADCVIHAKGHHTWQNQTGNLEGDINIAQFAAPDGEGVRGTWGALDNVYARIQELGGTILPKNGKYLAIPISREAKQVASPRDMPNLVFVQSVKGQPMLVSEQLGKGRKGKLGKVVVHWLLRLSVTLPARPYLRPAADEVYPQLAGNIRAAFEKAPAEGGFEGSAQ